MSTYQTVLPPAFPLYRGKRAVSLLRSTWIALSSVRLSLGRTPLVRPRPPAWAGGAFVPANATVASTTTATAVMAATSHHRYDGIFMCPPCPPAGPGLWSAVSHRRAISLVCTRPRRWRSYVLVAHRSEN